MCIYQILTGNNWIDSYLSLMVCYGFYLFHRNGVDTEEEIYRVTYFGKGRMPVRSSFHLAK